MRRSSQLASAKQFVADYAAAGYKDPYGAYGAYAYDAANAIINALKISLNGSAIDASRCARRPIDRHAAASASTGRPARSAFDQYGDATAKVLTVYKVTGGAWVADKTG